MSTPALGDRLVRIDPPVAEWMKLLKATPDRADKAVRKRFRDIAAEVRDEARGRASGSHPVALHPRVRTGGQHWKALVNSITSGATSNSPHVSIGSGNVPWALGFEFGSNRYPQFPPWKGNGPDAGYFFWPTVRDARDNVGDEMVKAIEEAMAEAFPN